MSGEKIQLAVYCGALAGMEDLAAVESIEGEYLHLQTRDGSIAPCTYNEEELQTAMQRLPEMMAIIREGIGCGVFFARASGSVRPQGHCEYCDFLVICGKDRQRRQASKRTILPFGASTDSRKLMVRWRMRNECRSGAAPSGNRGNGPFLCGRGLGRDRQDHHFDPAHSALCARTRPRRVRRSHCLASAPLPLLRRRRAK